MMALIPIESKMKHCKKCDKILPIDTFFMDRQSKDGHYSYCRHCESKRKKEERKITPERFQAASKKWYNNNKEKSIEKDRRWRKNSPEKIRNINLKNRFGITIEQYNEKLNEQNNACAICGLKAVDINYSMSVDHCHTTGVLRGILCRKCNIGLGHFNDNADLFKQAISYLSKYA